MTVGQLKAIYPGFNLILQGYPDSVPFQEIPRELDELKGKAYEKALAKYPVKGYKAIRKPYVAIDITHCLFGGKKRPNVHYEGTLYVYLKSDKPRRH